MTKAEATKKILKAQLDCRMFEQMVTIRGNLIEAFDTYNDERVKLLGLSPVSYDGETFESLDRFMSVLKANIDIEMQEVEPYINKFEHKED